MKTDLCHFCSIYYSILFQYYHSSFVGKTHCVHKLQRQTGKSRHSNIFLTSKKPIKPNSWKLSRLCCFSWNFQKTSIQNQHNTQTTTTTPAPHLVSLTGSLGIFESPLPVVPDSPRCTERGMKDEVSRTRAGRNGHVTLHMPDVEDRAFRWRLKAHLKSVFPR